MQLMSGWKVLFKPNCYGRVEYFRYCDDIIICCERQSDSQRIRKGIGERLRRFSLTLNEEKTKVVNFSRFQSPSEVKKAKFDFLGFSFYLSQSRKGKLIPKLRTIGKRFRNKLNDVAQWCRRNRHRGRLLGIWRTFVRKLQGHVNYYAVSYNGPNVKRFITAAVRIFFKWMNRRGQKRSFNWEQFQLFLKRFPPPKPNIRHNLLVDLV